MRYRASATIHTRNVFTKATLLARTRNTKCPFQEERVGVGAFAFALALEVFALNVGVGFIRQERVYDKEIRLPPSFPIHVPVG